jgi:Uma2 family endonuclease
MAATHPVRYTRAEYIALQRRSPEKHEFYDGNIYAMAGGSREHATISLNVGAMLREALRGRPCAAHGSDLRVRVLDTGLETYPGVTVICGHPELDPDDKHAVLNPVVLVEATSPSTEAYDRGEKLAHYKRIPSLREVVFVSHSERLVEVIRREEDGSWSRHEARPGRAARLESIHCELSVDEVYRDPLATSS